MNPTNIRNIIDDYLINNKTYKDDDLFIKLFGPYIAFNYEDFPQECKFLSSCNLFKAMYYSAVFIRTMLELETFSQRYVLFKDFISNIKSTFPPEICTKLTKMASEMLNKNFSPSTTDEALSIKSAYENFIAGASVIVPYEGMVKKQDPMYETNTYSGVTRSDINIIKDQIEKYKAIDLMKYILLYNFIPIDIVEKYSKDNVDPVNISKDFFRSISYLSPKVSMKVVDYFHDLILEYFGILDKSEFIAKMKSNLDKVFTMEDINISNIMKDIYENIPDNITATESHVSYDIDMLLGNMSVQDDIIVSNSEDPMDSNAKFDLTTITNFIYLNRYFQFNEGADRLLEENIKSTKIINTFHLNNNMKVYELNNNTMVVPFIDMRDYIIKLLILDANSEEPYITEDFYSNL